MSSTPPLVIKEAKWGAVNRSGGDIDVLEKVQSLVKERGGGRFLFIFRFESKDTLFGTSSKNPMELYLRWTYNGEMQTECFHHDQQVLIGDLDAYWASCSDQFGHIEPSVADALLYRYRPILHLHPRETSFPARVEWYLPQCELYVTHNDQRIRVLDAIKDPADIIRTYQHSNYNYRSDEKRRFFLKHIDTEAMKNGEGPNKLGSCPYYCSATVTPDGDICLAYFFFYAFNGAIMRSLLVPSPIRDIAGTHQGDWEYVAICLTPDGEEIRSVHMSRHAGAEGKWYLAHSPDLTRDSGWHLDPEKKRLVVYVSRESHANYNVPGEQDRGHGGFVDDETADGGAIWDPDYIVNLGTMAKPRVSWLRYGGIWGKMQEAKLEGAGPEGPCLKSVFSGRVYEYKSNNCVPTFGPWWKEAKAQADARIEAAGKSLVRKGKPSATAVPLQPSAPSHVSLNPSELVSQLGIAIGRGDLDAPASKDPSAPASRDLDAPASRGFDAPASRGFDAALMSAPPAGAAATVARDDPTKSSLGGIVGPDGGIVGVVASTPTKAQRKDMLDSSGEVGSTRLEHDTCLVSPNDEYRLWMRNDGNLVLYQKANGGKIVWHVGSKGRGNPPFSLECQPEGNVVIFDGNRVPLWHSPKPKYSNGPYHLIVQNDRNIVLVDRINHPVWSAHTNRDKDHDHGILNK